MFIRIKSTPNSPRKSVQIVASIRKKNRVKQKIIRYVGVATDEEEQNRLVNLAKHMKRTMEEEEQSNLLRPETLVEMAAECRRRDNGKAMRVDLRDIKEWKRIIIGIHEVYGILYKELGFHKLLRSESLNRALQDVVLARIAHPQSKRSTAEMLREDFGIELSLDKIYRMMDCIEDEVVERLQETVLKVTHQVLGEKIRVIFFDATTLYFESFKEDELKKNGYSKDCKFNQPQILLALLVTEEGLPIGYEIFPGSTYEGGTLLTSIDNLSKRYKLEKVVFVADSGMLNKKNLKLLRTHRVEYIVGARLKGLSNEWKSKVLDPQQYTSLDNEEKVADIPFGEGQRLIVHFSPKRAVKDAKDRCTTVEKLMEKLNKNSSAKSLVSNYGYKRFMQIEFGSKVSLNTKAIEEAKKWDGLHGVITNALDLSVKEVLRQYKGLWQVEESFHITKHDLRARPIFHWTQRRIRAHLAIAFMAFTCVRLLEYRIAIQQDRLSPETIRMSLMGAQVSIMKDTTSKKSYALPSKERRELKRIYQTMGLKYSEIPFQLHKGLLKNSR